MTDQEDSERRQQEFKEKTENFVKNLELDETLGQLLVAEGFSTIDDIKDSSVENLSKIEGIEEDTAKALIERAKEFYEKDQEDISQRIKDLGLEETLISLKGLTPGMLVTLGEQKILKLEDFADLASDELTGGYDVIKGERVKIQGYLEDFALSKEEADNLIMSARDIVYKKLRDELWRTKKTKLTISGTAKKSIKNIEIAKTQGKNSVIIEKTKNNFVKKQVIQNPFHLVLKAKIVQLLGVEYLLNLQWEINFLKQLMILKKKISRTKSNKKIKRRK